MAKRYILKSEITRVKAKHPPFELQVDAAEVAGEKLPQKVLLIPSAALLPDDVVLYSASQPVRAAKLLLGDDYPQFLAAGGTAQLLFAIIQEHSQADLGESEASSDS